MSKRRTSSRHLTAVETNNTLSFNQYVQQRKTVHLIPKSLNQETYIELLTDETKHIVFATGPAGTGKTMLAMLAGIKAFKEGSVSKIILTRPAVGVDDERHGFLPGNITAKMEPWTRPLFDVMQEYYSTKDIARMIDENTIEIAPLAFMRGRNFRDSWIIADEMQNATAGQIKMLLTRLGEGSKIVVTGDLQQMDKKFIAENGLRDFLTRLDSGSSQRISSVEFTGRDIQRHPVVAEVLKLYGEI